MVRAPLLVHQEGVRSLAFEPLGDNRGEVRMDGNDATSCGGLALANGEAVAMTVSYISLHDLKNGRSQKSSKKTSKTKQFLKLKIKNYKIA